MRRPINLAAAMAATKDQPAQALTLSELVHAHALATLDGSDTRLKKCMAVFGQLSAWEITSEQLGAEAQALLEHGYKASAVNRDLSALGSAYRWAKSKRLSPKGFRSPTLGVSRYEEAIRRVEVSAAHIDALRARSLAVRDRRFGAFVHLLVDTGARKSELLERRWRDVDLDAGTITCDMTKTGVPRVLHFRPETATLLKRVWKAMPTDGLLFEGSVPGSPISFRKAWLTATAEAGVPELHMHDLRHAAAADLLRAGVTLGVAAQVLGHSPQVLARHYGHLETAVTAIFHQRRCAFEHRHHLGVPDLGHRISSGAPVPLWALRRQRHRHLHLRRAGHAVPLFAAAASWLCSPRNALYLFTVTGQAVSTSGGVQLPGASSDLSSPPRPDG